MEGLRHLFDKWKLNQSIYLSSQYNTLFHDVRSHVKRNLPHYTANQVISSFALWIPSGASEHNELFEKNYEKMLRIIDKYDEKE